MISFKDNHQITNKATPMMFSNFSQASTLKAIYSTGRPENVWLRLQMNYREHRRERRHFFINSAKNPSGAINFANKLRNISTKLPPEWDKKSSESFKSLARKIFL